MGWALRIDGTAYLLTTAGVSVINVWSDGDNPGMTVAEGALSTMTGSLVERVRPLEGDLDAGALSFVVNDLPMAADLGITDLFTRNINSVTKTYLTASATLAAVTMTVADPSLFTVPCKAWIGQEAVTVTAKVGSVLDVTRAVYGSRAQAYNYDPFVGVTHEIYLACPWLTRRRVTLYRVTTSAALGVVATPRWIGYADHAPRLNSDGASWTISATHAWQRESALSLVSATSGARNVNFDSRAIRLTVLRSDNQNQLARGPSTNKTETESTFDEAMKRACQRLTAALLADGGTNPLVRHSVRDNTVTVTCQCDSIGDFQLNVQIGDELETGNSNAIGSPRATVTVNMRIPTALTRVGHEIAIGTPGDKFTLIAPMGTMPVADANWQSAQAGYGIEVRSTAILTTDVEGGVLELDPREQSSGTVVVADSTNTTPTQTTFKGRAKFRAKDPGVDPEPESTAIILTKPHLWRREFLVESDHWLYGLRWLVSDTVQVASISDSRNWTWAGIVKAATASASGTLAGATWRVQSERKLGEFVTGEAALRGACVTLTSGKIAIGTVTPPTAAETPAVTVTAADLQSGSAPQWEQWEDGLITSVEIASPMRDLTVVDIVAQSRFGDAGVLKLRAEGLRAVQQLIEDPLAFCRAVAQRPLRLWSDPVYLVRLPVTVALVDSISLLSVIGITQAIIPNGSGLRGMTAVKGVVIGITENFETGALDVEALIFPLSYGYAPCVRVTSIAGAVLTIGGAYAGTASDYAGSTLTGYTGTASDLGISRFVAGDKVRLLRRDNATLTTEDREVLSVNTGASTITLTVAPSAPWAGYSLVDLTYSPYTTCTVAQRAAYAFVSDSATPPVITAGVSARKFAP